MKTRARPQVLPELRRSGAEKWSAERIGALSVAEIKQLLANAERLQETELAALCATALTAARSAQSAARRTVAPRPRRLIPRGRAFQERGVWLTDPRTSWGGVRKSDGAVVMALWADDVVSSEGGCSYLLWRPNSDGARPWSDTAGGKERLAHCRQAMQAGRAEGMLVHGHALDGRLPQDRAKTVLGVNPEVVLSLKVELRGEDYWAVWGKGG